MNARQLAKDTHELRSRLKSGALVSPRAMQRMIDTHAGPRTWNELEALSGVDRTTIWRLRQPRAPSPKAQTVIDLAAAFECSPLDLLAKTPAEAKIYLLEAELKALKS